MRRLLLGFMLGACAALIAADGAPANGVSTNAAPAGGVRNPFRPMGYEGEREVISPDVRKRPKPAPKARPAITAAERAAREAEKAAAEKAAKEAAEKAAAKAAAEKAAKEAAARAEAERKKREITGAHWNAARAALKFGGRVKLREDDVYQNSSVVINGKVYADGDLVSFTHDSRRFTWRLDGLSDTNKLKLVRVRAKYLEKKPGEAGKKSESDKGANP